jgi:hypothetical protein
MSSLRLRTIVGLVAGDTGRGNIESLLGGGSAIFLHSACRGRAQIDCWPVERADECNLRTAIVLAWITGKLDGQSDPK